MHKTLSILLLLFFSTSVFAQSIALLDLEPGKTAPVGSAEIEKLEDLVYCANIQGGPSYCLKADEDPYNNKQFHVTFPASIIEPGGEYTLIIRHADIGAGIIRPDVTLGGKSLLHGRQVSYTRLNTFTDRDAYFGVKFPEHFDDITVKMSIEGLQHLRSIRLEPAYTDAQWQTAYDTIPTDVQPMVTLKRPMDLVTTAGIASNKQAPDLKAEIASLHELVPLAKVLGFNGIEAYVRWNLVEPNREGEFDWSYYDALVAEIQRYGMKWFPLLVVGSAYALPQWFMDSNENVEMSCLEHNIPNLIQSIHSPYHQRHVTRVLQAFGDHYEPTHTLLGVRLGPSGNYGESQYPAGGNWPAGGREMHIHIGLWAGDSYAQAAFRDAMKIKYGTISALNQAWEKSIESFEAIPIEHPLTMVSKRQRADFLFWYTRAMSDWCEWWGLECRKALPNTPIYQSSGGWGFVEAGTSYSEQTKSMTLIDGGIRLTNETDSFEQNFYATRLAATAARLYNVDLGYEPASSHTARGIAGRIYNTTVTNGDHLFTYHSNIMNDPYAIDQWLQYLQILDTRQDPVIDVAVYYPETFNQLDDSAFRHLYAWGFNPRAREIRRVVEVDYLDDNLLRDGFLDRYKVLVFAWGNVVEADVLAKVDAWVRNGGTVIYPSFPRGAVQTIEGDTSIFAQWQRGDTGDGSFHRFRGDMEPPSLYADFVKEVLHDADTLNSATLQVLKAEIPAQVFLSLQEDGHVLAINYTSVSQSVTLPSGTAHEIPAYGIVRFPLE